MEAKRSFLTGLNVPCSGAFSLRIIPDILPPQAAQWQQQVAVPAHQTAAAKGSGQSTKCSPLSRERAGGGGSGLFGFYSLWGFLWLFFCFPWHQKSAVTSIISAWWSPNWILTIIHVTENAGQRGRIKLYSKFCWANKMSSQTVNKSVKTVAYSIAKPGMWENNLGAQSVKKHGQRGRARAAPTEVPMASQRTLPTSCRTWQKSKGFWLFKKWPDPE